MNKEGAFAVGFATTVILLFGALIWWSKATGDHHTPGGDGFTLCNWTNYDQPNMTGTRIYVGDSPDVSPTNHLWDVGVLDPYLMVYQVEGLTDFGRPYYICSTSSIRGTESDCSPAVPVLPLPLPQPPQNFQCLSAE